MAKCTRCGKRGLFLQVNNRGHCAECIEEIKEERRRKANVEGSSPVQVAEPIPAPEPVPVPAAESAPQHKEPERHSRGSCIVGIGCALFVLISTVLGIRSLGNEARELQRLADETGLSVESIQQLDNLAVYTGTDFDAIIDSAKHMAQQVEDNPELFAEAGVDLTTPAGEQRSFDDIFWDTLYALADDKESVAEARNSEILSAETLQNASELTE